MMVSEHIACLYSPGFHVWEGAERTLPDLLADSRVKELTSEVDFSYRPRIAFQARFGRTCFRREP